MYDKWVNLCGERRSRKGAWIEIVAVDKSKVGDCVAPARERGLKFKLGFVTINGAKVAPARERGLKLRTILYLLFL